MPSYTTFKHPVVGTLLLIADEKHLLGVYFSDWKRIPKVSAEWSHDSSHPILQQATAQLRQYFSGSLKRFSIPIRFAGTDFQRRVWKQIAEIPFGETITYTELAKRVGAPQAIRAAGSATGKNPACVIVPCHRVVAKIGLGGFAGGLPRKRQLLAVERNSLANA